MPGFNYDLVGNLTSDATTGLNAMVYDAENRLTSYTKAGVTTQYRYDGDGRRVKKVETTGTTVFVYNAAGQLVAEYIDANQSGTVTMSYLTTDHLGSTRVVTDGAGGVKARYDYLPFGEEIESSIGGRSSVAGYGASDGIRQKFTGYERDSESGLDFAQARYYSSAQGRFTSPDPALASIDVSNPQTLSRYTYCLNNPLAYVDPDGLEELKVGSWKDLSEEQQRLFTTYVQNEYAQEVDLGDPTTFAENLWNASAAAANGETYSGETTSRLLDQSQLTTFAAVTHMLESKGVIEEIASITAINGEKQQADFAIHGELKDSNSAAKIEKVFSTKIQSFMKELDKPVCGLLNATPFFRSNRWLGLTH